MTTIMGDLPDEIYTLLTSYVQKLFRSNYKIFNYNLQLVGNKLVSRFFEVILGKICY